MYDLPYSYKQNLNSIYKQAFYKEIEEFKIHYFYNSYHHCYIINSFKWEQIDFLNAHNIIFYFYTNDSNYTDEFKKKLIHHKVSNVIFLSEPQNWILPNIEIKKFSKWVIFITEHPYQLFYKNIAILGGYHTIFFQDIATCINFIIEHYLNVNEFILFIDLDFPFDWEKFLFELNRKIFQYTYLNEILKIVCIKDLEKSFQFSLQSFITFRSRLTNLPPIKKIFSPDEVLILLIEALLFYDNVLKDQIYYHNINSLKELLYGEYPVDYLIHKRHHFIDSLNLHLEYYKKILPILWLYNHFKSIIKDSKTLILK